MTDHRASLPFDRPTTCSSLLMTGPIGTPRPIILSGRGSRMRQPFPTVPLNLAKSYSWRYPGPGKALRQYRLQLPPEMQDPPRDVPTYRTPSANPKAG